MIHREIAGVNVGQTGFWIQEVEGAAREGAVGGRTDSTATRAKLDYYTKGRQRAAFGGPPGPSAPTRRQLYKVVTLIFVTAWNQACLLCNSTGGN